MLAICAIFMVANASAQDNYNATTMGNFEAGANAPVEVSGDLEFTFTRNGSDVAVAVSGAEGVTATITATSPDATNTTTTTDIWNTGGAMANSTNILCTSTNTTNASESLPITYTLTVNGLKANITAAKFTNIAVNKDGGLQQVNNSTRQCNFKLDANGETVKTLSNQNIWVTTSGSDNTIEFNDFSVNANGTLTIKLTIYKGAENAGCYYGLKKITLTAAEPETDPLAGKFFRFKDKGTGKYMNVMNTAWVEGTTSVNVVEKNENSDTQIFLVEESDGGYKIKQRNGNYLNCDRWSTHANAEHGAVVFTFERTSEELEYLIKWDNKNTYNDGSECNDYFKVQDEKVFCDAAVEAAAVWVLEEVVYYTVKATAGEGGSVSPLTSTIEKGNNVTLTAIADTGYEFAGWYDGENKINDNASYTFTVTSDINYTARFREEESQEGLSTGYYYMVSRVTSSHEYLYNNALRTNNSKKYTLQSDSKVTTNNGIWHITVNNNELGVKNGDGNTLVTGANYCGNATAHNTLTIEKTTISNDIIYYSFSEGINCTNRDQYNFTLEGGSSVSATDNNYVTTWAGHPDDQANQWRLELVDTDGKNIYDVVVECTEQDVYVVYGSGTNEEYAFNGGFFITDATITAQQLTAKKGNDKAQDVTVLVEGNTIRVVDAELVDITVSTTPAEGGTVTVTINGQTVSTPQVAKYSEVTVVATPAIGYHFVNWTDADGEEVSTDASYKFTINDATELTANFEKGGYYHLISRATGRHEHLYNNAFCSGNTNHLTLQSDSKVTTNNGIWYIAAGDGNALNIKNGDGKPVVAGDDNEENGNSYGGIKNTFSQLNISSTIEADGYTYYYFSEALNCSNIGSKLVIGDNINYLTTWTGNPNATDNHWRLEPADTKGKNIYDVLVECTDNTDKVNVYVTYGSEYAFDGGFFITDATIEPEQLTAKKNGAAIESATVLVEGNTIKVVVTEYVDITVSAAPNEGGTATINGENVNNKQVAKNSSVTVVATPADGYRFVNWTKEGVGVSTDATYTFTATEAIDLVANFENNKPVNVVLTDNTNSNNQNPYVFEFVLDDLEGEVTTAAIANKLMEKYPVIKSVGEGNNATLTDNGTSYTYTNTVKLPFEVANGKEDDAVIWYNIYYPANLENKPNYLSASTKETTLVEKINDDTFAYGDNPEYNTVNGNNPISWAIYSVDKSLTFTLKNKVTRKYIKVTGVATNSDNNGKVQNAVFADETNATAFTFARKTESFIDYFAFEAEIDGTTGYLCSTVSSYGWATHYNSKDHRGGWARIEDPAYYTKYFDLNMGLYMWFREGNGFCTVTSEIQDIKDALENHETITLNTFVQYGITIARADSLWPTLNINITPEIGGFTAINGEENVKTKRAPEDYQIPIKAIPAEGYHFVNWTDSTGTKLSTNVDYATSISGPKGYVTNITANFKINTYTIGVTANGEGGSAYIVSPGTTNANIEHGTEVTLTATANNGYEFVNWTKEGVEVSTDAAYTFIATADGEYTANFVEIKEVAAVRYYRIGYDFDNGGKRYYMQSVACGVVDGTNDKPNALKMTQETGAASIFYYADSKLLSYDKGTYVKEDGGTRGLQAVGESGTVTITTSQSTGKSTISAPNYLHANQSGTTYFVDHSDSNPDNYAANHNFVLEEVTTLPVTISAALHATFYAPVAVKIPEGVIAYILKAEDIPGIETYAWMTSLKNGIIPANTGVIIKGAADTYYFDIVENNDAARAEAVDNVLSGTVAKTKITEDAYILANRDGKVGLYPVAKNSYLDNNTNETTVRFTNNSHKAYLPVTNDWFGEQLKNGTGFRFIYDDEETTGIKEFETENTETIYDLQGRKLSEITAPGIYIIDGKKVWVK